MLMSIFSSIYAFCAQTIGPKLLVANTNINPPKDPNSKSNDHAADVKKPPKLEIRPRFAPELDGVYCFETILPY